MSEYVWAKVYLELPSDPKLVGRSAHDCYLWVCMILISKTGDGSIQPWQAQAKYLSKYARIPLKEAVAALIYFEDVGMVKATPDAGYILPNFAKRQRRKASDSPDVSRERKRLSRAGHADVTPMSRPSHAIRTREEADRNPDGLLAEVDPPKSPRGPRLPILEEAVARTDATKAGFSEAEFVHHFQAFRNYGDKVGWRSKAGAWKDYNAAFRSWLDNEKPSGRPAGQPLKAVY